MPNVIIPEGGVGVIAPTLQSQYVNPAQPDSGVNYVAKNERWDSVAFKMYGDPTQVGPLILNNPGILIEDLLASGTVVFVPLITPTVPTTTSTPWN